MPTRDPKAKLTAALDTLDTYTKENNPKPIQNASSIRQMIGFAQTLVSVDRIKPHTVIRAIEDVKRYHPIINGSISEESQKLSERALDSIHRFNQLSKNPTKWYQKLFRFFFKTSKEFNKAARTIRCCGVKPAIFAISFFRSAKMSEPFIISSETLCSFFWNA